MKDGSYTVKSNMDMLEGGIGDTSFPRRLVWNQLVHSKVGFCVGRLVGQGNDFGPTEEKRFLPC